MAELLPRAASKAHSSPQPGLLQSSGWSRISSQLKKVTKRQMDFEVAAWQLTYLCIAPRRVYRNVYYHKQTKNTWARDDPAMVVLIICAIAAAAVLWSIIYAHYSVFGIIQTILSMILLDFFFIGILIATALWALSNRFLTHSSHTHATDQKVEWAYAFDVHANSFFPFFLQLYVAQLFLSPVITRNNWVCLFAGNTLYMAAIAQYIYVTYLQVNFSAQEGN